MLEGVGDGEVHWGSHVWEKGCVGEGAWGESACAHVQVETGLQLRHHARLAFETLLLA